jgi:hypothetical protein
MDVAASAQGGAQHPQHKGGFQQSRWWVEEVEHSYERGTDPGVDRGGRVHMGKIGVD